MEYAQKLWTKVKGIPKHLIISAAILIAVICTVLISRSISQKNIHKKVTQKLADEFYHKFAGKLTLIQQDSNPYVMYQHIMEAVMCSDSILHLLGSQEAASRFGEDYQKSLQDLNNLKTKVMGELSKSKEEKS